MSLYGTNRGQGGGGGGGTVTSVAFADSTGLFAISGSPVTTSGTLTLSALNNQTQNAVFAGPASGGAGAPTFRALQAADIPTLAYLSTTLGATATSGGMTVTGNTLSMAQAATAQNGWLSSTDWNTFNGKTSGGITALTGDGTATGPGSAAFTLASVATGATTGGSTAIPVVTFNNKGLVTGITTAAVVAPAGTLSGTALNSTVVTSSLTALGTIATGTWQGSLVGTTYGGTGVNAVTTAPTASAFAGWDANKNLTANNLIDSYTTTVTSATPVALVVGSTYQQFFTGTTAQTVTLPSTAGLVLGQSWVIYNNSNQTLTLETSTAATVKAMAAGTYGIATCISTGGNTAAAWNFSYAFLAASGTVTSVGCSVPSFLSVSGSPVTTSGTLAITLNSGTALPNTSGGTGQASAWNAGGLIYASNTTTLASTAVGTADYLATSNGSGNAPSFKQINLGTSGGLTGQLPISLGGTGQATANPAFNALSPLTTKGDTLTYTTVNARQAVPGDYGSLIPDSTTSSGWRSSTYLQDLQGRPGKNYIQYADFENNSTTGWTLGTIGTLTNGLPTGAPTFGSGASGNLSIAATSTSIEGAYSLNYVSSAATTQGNMVASSSYAIDVEDQAKVLTVKFYYTVPSGVTNCNFSGTSSNSYAWAVYDVTNSVWLTSAGNFNLIQSSGCGYVTGTVQTGATTANIRLCVYNANATSGAATITLDGFYVGPQTAPSGPAMTDWASYTPTISAGFGTCTNVAFFYKREGDTLRVQGTFTSGTIAASLGSFSLPSGLNLDSTKITLSTTTSSASPGFGLLQANAASNVGALVACLSTSTSVLYFSADLSGSNSLTPTNVSSVLTSNALYTLSFAVPVAGWSSNSSQSSDSDTRVVAMQATNTSNLSITGGATIVFQSVTYDTHGAMSSGVYTVPVSGYYNVSLSGFYDGSANTYKLFKNGSVYLPFFYTVSTGPVSGSIDVKCNAGDTLTIVGSNTTTLDYSAGNQAATVSISRKSGPAVIAATESVNGRYYSSSTSISGSLATVVYATKGWDTHGAYNASTGIWTCPVSGKYQFNANLDVSGTIALNNTLDCQLQQSGSSSQISEETVYAGGAVTAFSASFGDIFYCLAGDTVKLQASSSATLPTIVSSNNKNYISWSRVGN